MEYTELLSAIQDFLNLKLFELQDTPVTIMSITIFVIFLTVFGIASGIVRRFLRTRFLTRFDIDSGLRYTLSRIAQYIIVLLGVLISFQFVGIDLTSLAVVFGLLSVGIGFGLQNITANFISGLIIMFERPISVGDRVDVGGVEGDVTEINIRSTKIRTPNDISIIVPNSKFVENNVVNYSHGNPTFRLDIDVGVSYGSDLDTVVKALDEVAKEHDKVLKKPSHQVHLVEFGDSAWEMQLRTWIPDVKNRYMIRNELHQAIVHKFREYGVEIPFPQRDLHVRSSVGIPLQTEQISEPDENEQKEKSG
ncbi:MAG: mechanosensitive ion channel family protein [Balneolaceae bacterium]